MAIDWRNEPVIDSVQLPGSETKYWVQDTEAREKIETLANATHFIGVSTTEITDGGTEKPTINEKEVNPVTGDIVIWKPLTGAPLEFIWDGSKWNLLGGQALEGLGDLAFKDSAEGSYTPEGSIDLITETMQVVTSVSSNFDIYADFTTEPVAGYSDVTLDLYVALDTSSISYFGSSQGINHVNLSMNDNEGKSYGQVVTSVNLDTIGVVSKIYPGALPYIANQSTVTVAMGTGSSSTTLIFNLSDIGFDPGTTTSATYAQVYYASEKSKITYASVGFSYLSPTTANIVTAASGVASLYYSVGLYGSVGYSTDPVLSSVTTTFSGTTSTITVS